MYKNIIIKDHAIERFMSDRFFRTKARTRKHAENQIIKAIEFSKLIKIESNGIKLRGHNGKIYVCAVSSDSITVITVLKANTYVS